MTISGDGQRGGCGCVHRAGKRWWFIVTREFTRLVVAALCCIPAISIAASDDPKEIERLLAKVRNEPIIFILATGEPNACVTYHSGLTERQGRTPPGIRAKIGDSLIDL